MKIKKMMSILLCITMLGMLTACSGGSGSEDSKDTEPDAGQSGKTKITILRPGDEEKVASFMEPAVEAFEKDNPDIEVEIMYESWAGWIQTYPTYFEADTQPDVIFWWDNKLHDSSANPKLIDLEPYLGDEIVERISDSVWDLVEVGDLEGIRYIPSSVDTFVLYYNKDVFREAGLDPDSPPADWDEMLKAAKTIYEKTGKPGIGCPAITGSEVLEEFVGLFINQASDQAILDPESMPLFDTEEGLQALEYVESLAPYFQTSPTEYGRGELRPLIRDGEMGMLIDGPWAVNTFTEAFGADLDSSSIGVVNVPIAENGKKITWAGTNGWIATRGSTAEASAKLIEFLMNPEQLTAHHLAYGSAPLYESEFDNEAFQYDYWKVFYEEAQSWTLYGMIGKNSATPGAYYTALEEVWQRLILGQVSAEDAMKEAVASVENVTSRNQ